MHLSANNKHYNFTQVQDILVLYRKYNLLQNHIQISTIDLNVLKIIIVFYGLLLNSIIYASIILII